MARVFTISEGLENLGAMKTGGQGSVYKGKRIGEVITAIKILPTPIFSESPADKNYSSFQNEVQKLKKVNETPNPNVVKILSSGITDSGNFPYIEMEFIEGPDLEELLRPPHEKIFTIKDALKVTDQLSHALAHCHKVEVKHGDIKSNNIKFNTQSGNYVLLDFGMAIMSDEQRRTSMRHAGAVEFMAPEQNDGLMLFETDIYSFGVVLYELLAGTVPFPMKERSESSRNKVMVAHMEMVPPDLLELRRQNLPDLWSDDKKEHEMHLPEWLVSMIYKCLEKKPEHRFSNGIELCDYVTRNSIITASKKEWIDERITLLQQENERLMREKEQLQARLLENQRQSSTNTFAAKQVEETIFPSAVVNDEEVNNDAFIIKKSKALTILLIVLVIAVAGYLLWKNNNNNQVAQTSAKTEGRKNDTAKQAIPPEIVSQLTRARKLVNDNKPAEALVIYKALSEQQIPEALFEYGNLALQNINRSINCKDGFDLITQASTKGYSPAKTTLGVIYSYADNPAKLEQFNYHARCNFSKNPAKAKKLLVEAMLGGDKLAATVLDSLKSNNTIPEISQ